MSKEWKKGIGCVSENVNVPLLGRTVYSDKFVHVQVIINYQYFIARMCTHEDALAYHSGVPSIDDDMSYNSLTTEALFFNQACNNLENFPELALGLL